jgi:hypothetical protein
MKSSIAIAAVGAFGLLAAQTHVTRAAPASAGSASGPPTVTAAAPIVRDHTQFLVVIDDSSSMGSDTPHTDEDRLAILAAKLFVELLGDNDAVAIVGMNRLAKPAPGTKLTPLPPSKFDFAQLDENGGKQALAAYDWEETPCGGALKGAQTVLDDWSVQDPKARQVLLFMTDGACTDGVPPFSSWNPTSKMERSLQVQLVGFEGNDFTPTLKLYAPDDFHLIRKGRGDRLNDLVDTFATVFARAQGYAPIVVGPGMAPKTFARAERLRVLAVREKDAAPLAIDFLSKDGPRTPATFAPKSFLRTGKKAFDYGVATIKPSAARITVDVSKGAHALLVPDYRGLHAELHLVTEACPANNAAVLPFEKDEKGGDYPFAKPACLEAFVAASHDGKVAPLDPADDLAYEPPQILVTPSGKSEWQTKGASPCPNGGALAAPNTVGAYDVKAIVRVDAKTTLESSVRTIEARAPIAAPPPPSWSPVWAATSSTAPRALKLDAGAADALEVRVDGRNFAQMPVSYARSGAAAADKCIRYELKGAKGDVHPTNPGDLKRIDVTVDRDCREAGIREGVLRIAPTDPNSSLQPFDLKYSIEVVPTPWLWYWGPWVLKGAGALFALMSLGCLLRGFGAPAREPGDRLRGQSIYFSIAAGTLGEQNTHFEFPTHDGYGAKALSSLLEGQGGWYRNARVERQRVLMNALDLDLELVDAKELWLVAEPNAAFVVRQVDLDHLKASDWQRWSKREWSSAGPTLRRVGFPCRLYASLFGRWTVKRHIKLDMDWLAISRRDDEAPELFVKLDIRPDSAS